jgi:ketosteroid isomerase-like protein
MTNRSCLSISMRRIAGIAAALSAVACSGAADRPSPSAAAGATVAATADEIAAVRREIDGMNHKATVAMQMGDHAAWQEVYADTTIILRQGGMAIDPVDVMLVLREKLRLNKMTDVQFTTHDVILSGNLAVETGTFSATVTPRDGKSLHEGGSYVHTWQRDKERTWRIVRDIISVADVPITAERK